MTGPKKSLLALVLAGTVAAAAAQSAYPSRPIRLVVGFPPGGSSDAAARVVGEALSRQLKTPVIVDNKPGAGGTLATEYVARAAPDGYTVLLSNASLYGADKVLFRNVRYDAQKDFTPVGLVVEAPLIVAVSPSLGLKDLRGLVALSKASPDRVFYASAGAGTPTHLAGLHLNKLAGVSMVHVPFKGGSPAAQSVVAKETQVIFATPAGVMPLLQSGMLQALAVTSAERFPLFPSVPSATEAGFPTLRHSFWLGAYGPAKLPRDVVDKLHESLRAVLAESAVQERLARQGVLAAPSVSVEAFARKALDDGRELTRLTVESGAVAE